MDIPRSCGNSFHDAQVNLPIKEIALILGLDRLMDMIRTAVNIPGDPGVLTPRLDIHPAAETHLADIAHHGQGAGR